MPESWIFFKTGFWIVVASVALFVFFLWLFIIGGNRYTIEDTEAHAEDFGEVIKEGHGGMTSFLWISFAILFIWTIGYFVVNWRQFLVIFAGNNG